MYFPNVRQPETVRFPGWAWQLGACPWYTGEQGPEKLCHGDSVNQAPMPCPVTGDTWEPCQELLAPHPPLIHPTLGLSLCRALGVRREGPTVPPGLQQDAQGSRTGRGRKDGPGLRQGRRGLAR